MTEPLNERGWVPLIEREALMDVLYPADPAHADAVIAYLRKVLTPEALTPWEEVPGQIVPDDPDADLCGPSIRVVNGDDLHRRIFGEDK